MTTVVEITNRFDRALANAEDATLARIYQSLDASYKQLERELLAAYTKQQSNTNLLPRDRKLLVLDRVKDLIGLVRPDMVKTVRSDFEKLYKVADRLGNTIASDLAKAIASEELKSFADVPIEALRFQAEDGVERLRRHGEEFASRTSAIVEQGLIQGWGARKVASLVRAEVGVTKGKAESITRTESLSSFNAAIERSGKINGQNFVQVFATAGEGLCPTCAYRNQQIYKLGEIRLPSHPRCRCCLVPISQAAIDAGLVNTPQSRSYREAGLEALSAAGKTPNSGVSAFERAAGSATPPKPIRNATFSVD